MKPCGKKVFTKLDAQAAIKRNKKSRYQHRKEKRYYYCEACSGWHLSSLEEWAKREDAELTFKDQWQNLVQPIQVIPDWIQKLFKNNRRQMKLSVAITTYCRYDWTIRSIEQLLNNDRINDFVILDDCSPDGSYLKLREHYKGNPKVRVIQQLSNRKMARNKRDAISLCKNEWVLIGDSDNIFTPYYIDAIFLTQPLFPNTIYCPLVGEPNLDYTLFKDIVIDKSNIKEYIDKPYFAALENTCNYVVNRDFYLKVWQENETVKGIDTHWHLYNHLKNDGAIFVVPGCKYIHTTHDGSEWMKDAAYNMKQYKEIDELIKAL